MARGKPRFYPGAGPWSGRNVRYAGFEPDKVGILRVALGRQIDEALGEIVREAVVFAELIAPNDSQEYQTSFFTEVKVVRDIPFRTIGEPMARWSGRVGNNSDHAILVEVGGNHTPDHRVLRRTLEWIERTASN